MSNINNLNQKKMQALLNMASKKLNTTPEKLQKNMENGSFDKALKDLPPQQAAMLKQALTNKSTVEKILSTPQAQTIYKKLTGDK